MTQSVTELGLPTPKERRRLREAADLTHEEVAAAVGVTPTTVRSWETGRTDPRGRKREAYAKFLTRLSTTGPDQDTAPAEPGRDRTETPAGAAGPAADAAWEANTEPGRDRSPEAATGPDGPATDTASAADTHPGRDRPGEPGDTTDAASAANTHPGLDRSADAATEPPVGEPDDATTSPPWQVADAASAVDLRSGPAEGATDLTADADTDADTDADAESAGAAGANEGRFGLRTRGLARPGGAQTRPKAAVKRAAKPPVGVPRHEAKATVKAAAGSTSAGLATLRPGAPMPLSTGAGPGTGAGAGAGPGTGAGGGAGEGAGESTGPGTGAGGGAGPGTGAGGGAGESTGPGTGADTGTAAGPDADTDTGTGTGPATAEAEGPGREWESGPGSGPGEAGPGDAAPGADPRTAPQGTGTGTDPRTAPQDIAAEAFDALYARTAAALARQAYLLTGRRALAQEAVERAFHQAWRRWPEVATDPDPVGWVRTATYEYALSPWHQFRRAHKHPDKPPADPADRILLDAMLALPTAHRRTVLLYDGVGLDLPDTAAETEASTPTAGGRLVNAHADLADRIPELADVAPGKQSALLRERLGALRPAVRLEPRAAAAVRAAGERRTRLWTRATLGLTAVIAATAAYTAVTAPTEYEPPRAPGANVSGVPPHSGPQQLSDEGRQLHDRLASDPAAGPARVSPKAE
ncbi:helix-turn-helix domain-containing protein [Streptomyces sp. ISL-43]|uniref:helix-turn-helix domain-containing protein n=1 Tax=Streptomyces sp. ISL-43 TaxID=2819183 RepID=UPI0035A8AA70